MDANTIIAIINFIPAAFLLYIILGKYEGYFKDNKAFFSLIIGLGIGMGTGIFSLYFPLNVFLWTLAFIGLIDLIKLTILIQKPFRLNHDTTFYGMALGIGIGAMFLFMSSFYAGLESISAKTTLFIFLLAFNFTFINSSTGAIIGYGSYQGEFWRFFFRAFIIHGIHGMLVSFVWGGLSETSSFALLIIDVIFNILVFLYVINIIFKKTIPKELKKAKQKDSKS